MDDDFLRDLYKIESKTVNLIVERKYYEFLAPYCDLSLAPQKFFDTLKPQIEQRIYQILERVAEELQTQARDQLMSIVRNHATNQQKLHKVSKATLFPI